MLQGAIRSHVADGHAKLAELATETDDGLLWRIRQAGGTSAELVGRLWERRLYKRAYEGSPDRAAEPLVVELQRSGARREKVAAEIADTAGVPWHEVLLDVPRPPRFRELGLQVRQRDGTLEPLTQASRLVAVLQEARLDHWRFWVFAPKAVREKVGAAATKVLGPAAGPRAVSGEASRNAP
jgi:HD superfamily phosphohydrolase